MNEGYKNARCQVVISLQADGTPKHPTAWALGWLRIFEVVTLAALSRGESAKTLGMPDA